MLLMSFFSSLLSLYFPPLFLGLELHNVVNLSVWRELCYLEILLAGPIYSELLPFAVERKMPSISASAGFMIDRVASFEDSKSSLMQIYFIALDKILALARFERDFR